VFPTDVLLLLAIGAWLASRLSGVPPRHPVVLSRVFGWPLVLLAVSVMAGVLIGHGRYGASIVGQPLRLVIYSGIALALTDVSVSAAWRAITAVFYAGAVLQSILAVYYLATGTSQTESVALTTGGVRTLALSTAIFLTGSLACALLNLDLNRNAGRQAWHLVVAGLALFGIIVSYGRTTFAAVVVILPLLLLSRRHLRRSLILLLPLMIPIVVAGALVVHEAKPDIGSTLQARLGGTSTDDGAVQWRERALRASLAGVRDEWVTGVGFGRRTEFELERQVVEIEGDPHNSFAWLLGGGGALALGAFLVVCVTFVVDAVRRLRHAERTGQVLIVWALVTWLSFMINALTGPILTDPEMLMTIWVLMTLPSVVPRAASA
jgi:hypothetical protein